MGRVWRSAHPEQPEDEAGSSDARLVDGLRRGAPAAFAGLHERYATGIYNLALRVVRHGPDAEDITQDVLIRAFERLPQDREVLLRPWLYRLTLNRCYDYLRGSSRRPLPVAAAADAPSSVDPYEQSELQQLLEAAIGDLTRRQRAALLLKDVHGLSLVEVAACLDLTPGSVEVLLARARRAFRASFEQRCVAAGRPLPRTAGGLAALPLLPLPASLVAQALPLPLASPGHMPPAHMPPASAPLPHVPPAAVLCPPLTVAAGSGISAVLGLPASVKTAVLIAAAAATVGTAERTLSVGLSDVQFAALAAGGRRRRADAGGEPPGGLRRRRPARRPPPRRSRPRRPTRRRSRPRRPTRRRSHRRPRTPCRSRARPRRRAPLVALHRALRLASRGTKAVASPRHYPGRIRRTDRFIRRYPMPLQHPRNPYSPRKQVGDDEVFTSEAARVPAHELPAGEMRGEVAYQIVHDELMLDGNARLNLATFVTTWMEPHADRLMAETFDKNMIDKDEYPQTADIEKRCVDMLAASGTRPSRTTATGCSTTGLERGGHARRPRAQAALAADGAGRTGKPTDRPNLVMGDNVQVCWDKFANYWDVEPRLVPMEGDRFHLTPDEAVDAVRREHHRRGRRPGFDLRRQLRAGRGDLRGARRPARRAPGLDVPVHVDGASGGFIAPFLRSGPRWDFRVPRVASINISGHKYGLVYPGVGWVLWRDAEALPEDLVFHVNYLGGDMPTFALNFSRPGAQVVAQYYNFLRLGSRATAACSRPAADVAMYTGVARSTSSDRSS